MPTGAGQRGEPSDGLPEARDLVAIQGPRGFTLLEMLIVLSVLALAVAMIAPGSQRYNRGKALDTKVTELSAFLRHSRARAIGVNHPVSVVFQIKRRLVTADSGTGNLVMPADLSIRIESAAQLSVTGRPRIVFFPDGTSSGGRITLADENRSADISVEWLTGRVRTLYSAIHGHEDSIQPGTGKSTVGGHR